MSNKTIVRVLVAMVLVLAVLNITVLSLIFLKKKPTRKGFDSRSKRSMTALFESGAFSDEQQALIISKSELFRAQSHKNGDKLHELRNELRKQILTEVLDSNNVDSLTALISAAEAGMITGIMYHMRDLRSLCTDDQLPVFDAWHTQMMRHPPPPQGVRPPHKNHRKHFPQ